MARIRMAERYGCQVQITRITMSPPTSQLVLDCIPARAGWKGSRHSGAAMPRCIIAARPALTRIAGGTTKALALPAPVARRKAEGCAGRHLGGRPCWPSLIDHDLTMRR